MSDGIEMAKDFRIVDLLCRIESRDDQDNDIPRESIRLSLTAFRRYDILESKIESHPR